MPIDEVIEWLNLPECWRRRKENLNDDKGRREMRQEPGQEMLGKAVGIASTAPNWNEMRALPWKRNWDIFPPTPPHLLPVASRKLEMDHNLPGLTSNTFAWALIHQSLVTYRPGCQLCQRPYFTLFLIHCLAEEGFQNWGLFSSEIGRRCRIAFQFLASSVDTEKFNFCLDSWSGFVSCFSSL